MRLADLSWPEVAEQAGMILALPVGATEQHGPHLPLSTDTDIAVALTERLAARRTDVVVAPPLAIGSSGEHAAFPGTLSIGRDVLKLALIELVRSARLSYDAVLLVSAHGGNAAPISAAVRQLRDEGHDVAVVAPRWEGDPHAGRAETSLMLALRPELVRIDRAVAGPTQSLTDLLPRLKAEGVRAVSESGVLGDPTGASAIEGNQLLAAITATMSDEVASWRMASP